MLSRPASRSAFYYRSAFEAIMRSVRRSSDAVAALSPNAVAARTELASLVDHLQVAKQGRGKFCDPKIQRPSLEKIAAVAELACRAERLAEEALHLREDAVKELAGLETWLGRLTSEAVPEELSPKGL
jgi:hypothetical protein